MPAPAPWWTDPNHKDDKPVVAHTPDETQYHYPDDRQMERMRGGITMGVVIPRANDDGTSKGFDGRVAGVVHVDPDAPDGGAVVDLSQIDPNSYYHAFEQATYPHEVFYQLGQHPTEYGVQRAAPPSRPVNRSNHLVPTGSYIVPASAEDGTQVYQQPPVQEEPMKRSVPPLPPLQPGYAPPPQAPAQPMPVQAPVASPVAPQPTPPVYQAPPPAPAYAPPQAFPQPVYAYPPAQPAMPAVPPLDVGQMYGLIGQLTQQVQGLATQLQQQQAVPPVSPEAPPAHAPLRTMPQARGRAPARARPPQPSEPRRPMAIPRPPAIESEEEDEVVAEEYTPRQTLREVQEAAHNEVSDGIVMGFETLNMRFVKGPLPEKPRREVFFTMPGMGTMSVRYHDVRDGGSCLALVYDTRYEDGQQFLPPDLADQKIEVAVPRVKQGKRIMERHVCSSMGLHFQVGVLDIVVLIKHAEESEADVEEEEDTE